MASAGCRKNAGVPVLVERRGDLPADDARLAHAGEDDAAAAVVQQLDGAIEPVVEARHQRENRRRFGFEHLPRERRDQPWVESSGAAASARFTMASMRHQAAEQRLEQVEAQRVLRVALRARRILVHLEEHAVDAGRDAGRRQRLDVLRQAGRDAVAAARQLQAVRDVEHHRHALLAHDRERAHVDDEVVVAEARAALGDDDARVAGVRRPSRPRAARRRARGTGPS